MEILSVLFLAIAATADSFSVGFHYGIKKVKIGVGANICISLICLAGTTAAMLAGKQLGFLLSPKAAHTIGGFALICFGLYMLYKAIRPGAAERYVENPKNTDKDSSNIIELKESLFIGAALALNNISLGIGAGATGISFLLAPPFCAAASFCFIAAGCALGRKITAPLLAKALELFSAGLVLMLGILGLI